VGEVRRHALDGDSDLPAETVAAAIFAPGTS
jgi:hypothetical protein